MFEVKHLDTQFSGIQYINDLVSSHCHGQSVELHLALQATFPQRRKTRGTFRTHSTSAVLWNLSRLELPRPLWGHTKPVPQERRSPHNAPYLHPMRSPSFLKHLLIAFQCELEKSPPAASELVKTVGTDGDPAGCNPASPPLTPTAC